MIPTIAEAAKQIAAKQLSPVEFMKDRLAKAEALNPEIHAFIRFTPEIALAQAQAAEARQMAGTLKGPLDGIPIGHKDIYETAGVPTTGHSRVLIDHVPTADAAAVTAWAEGGAVMLGKLATHEFAWGGPSFDLPWPPARNPWDTTRFTAGSSSAAPARIPAGRSVAPRRCAARRGSSRPMGCARAVACCRCRIRSTPSARSPGPSRIAPSCSMR